MKTKLVLVLLLIFPAFLFSQTFNTDSVLNELYQVIDNRNSYYMDREKKISSLKEQAFDAKNEHELFSLNNRIFSEYKSYQFDSALVYAHKLIDIASKTNNKSLIMESRCNLLFCFVGTGLFKEAFDLTKTINVSHLPDSIKANYYTLCTKLYSNINRYNKGYLQGTEYEKDRVLYCDSALMVIPPGSLEYEHVIILRNLDYSKPNERISAYLKALQNATIDDHQKAIDYSSIGKTYKHIGDTDKAIYYMALSVIYDIKSATRETTSKTALATYLYDRGNIEAASKLIDNALEDANFYNARHHKISINSIMPIIEKERMNMVEKQKNMLIGFSVVISIMLIALLIALIIIYKQIKLQKLAKATIQDQYNKLEIINDDLKEANDIKDHYIIQSLYGKSEYIDKVEGLLLKLDRKLKSKQYDDIYRMSSEFEIKKERENLSSSFDQTFLKLFPNFIEEYNRLFNPEDQVKLDSQNLTPELRIFALIRLGITENERIAKFLNFSVNTIYSYKAKVKGKSIVPNEEFEYKIAQIKKKDI